MSMAKGPWVGGTALLQVGCVRMCAGCSRHAFCYFSSSMVEPCQMPLCCGRVLLVCAMCVVLCICRQHQDGPQPAAAHQHVVQTRQVLCRAGARGRSPSALLHVPFWDLQEHSRTQDQQRSGNRLGHSSSSSGRRCRSRRYNSNAAWACSGSSSSRRVT